MILAAANNYFDDSASSTFQNTNKDFYLGFLGGSSNGTTAIETVSVIYFFSSQFALNRNSATKVSFKD